MSHLQEETVITILSLPIQPQFKLRCRAGPFRVCMVEDKSAIVILSDLFRMLNLNACCFHFLFPSNAGLARNPKTFNYEMREIREAV
jgi:hypothetical protein